MNIQLNDEKFPDETTIFKHVGTPNTSYELASELLAAYADSIWLRNYFGRHERKSTMKGLPKLFADNKTIKKLCFTGFRLIFELDDEVLRACIVQDNITVLDFDNCKQREFRIALCEALRERVGQLQLEFRNCDSKFVAPIAYATAGKCFSLFIEGCYNLGRPLRNHFIRASLCYVTLSHHEGLEEKNCLELARCVAMLPGLAKLDLTRTPFSTAALKRLYGSLNLLLIPGRTRVLQVLSLDHTAMDGHLAYSFFTLLRSDAISAFSIRLKIDAVFPTLVKNICSTVAGTSCLTRISTKVRFTSGTNFDYFKMQRKSNVFSKPFQVNAPNNPGQN